MAIPLRYNLRSLLVRRVSTLVTVLSIALIVTIFVGVMALANGLETVLTSTGNPLNVIVLSRGSGGELLSSVPREALSVVKFLPGVQAEGGDPAASAELVTVNPLPKRGDELNSNLTIRGISPQGLGLRPQIRIVEGRMLRPGLREVLVSSSVARKFQNAGLGEKLQFGKGDWQVVGVFDANNTAFGSEVWVDVNQLANDFGRQTYSSILLRASSEAAAREIISRVEADASYNLTALPEVEYYKDLTRVALPLKALGFFIALVMGVGACFAAMNTMYAAVTYRTQEIATLRTLGFKKRNILLSFMFESLLLALAGGVLGCLLTLPINGVTTGTINMQTFSEVAFAFRVSPWLLLIGMIFSTLIGLFGGIFPARYAARQAPAAVMREV